MWTIDTSEGGEAERLTGFMECNYGGAGMKLHSLAHGGKSVYRVGRAEGLDWVLRAYPLPDPAAEGSARALAAMLGFLERSRYPAERVVHTLDGSLVTVHENRLLLITTYLGQPLQAWQPADGASASGFSVFDHAPHTLRAFGEAVGRLHALQPDEGPPLPPAGMLPGPELAYASECLARVAGRVPVKLQSEYAFLVGEVQGLDHCTELPHTVLHNDCNLGNAVVTPQGDVALVDWEGAGMGPAVIDVGFMLANCFDKQRTCLNQEALIAVIEGYCRRRHLTEPELKRLDDAVRFRTLVLLACCFASRAEASLRDDELIYGATYLAWKAQYAASGKIIEMAQDCFAG